MRKICADRTFVVLLQNFSVLGSVKQDNVAEVAAFPRLPDITDNLLFMYAIVEMQGQQFKAEAGKWLFIHRVENAEVGATLEFDKVLLIDNDGAIEVGAPVVAGAKVVCEVLDNSVRGEKVLVFHKKRRKGYRKLNGHRQDFTKVMVKQIVNA